MIECIKNLNIEGPMNKENLFDILKTKSTHINSIILSKIEIFSKFSDFFTQFANVDINSISKSIDYLDNIFSNLSFPNSNDEKDIDHYLKILSKYIIIIYYNLKIKNILETKLKDFHQHFLEELMNNKLKDEYKDKIIEFNSLSYSIFNTSFLHTENSFSTFLNRTKNNKNDKKYFNNKKEDPTPKFCVLDIEQKSQFNKNKKIENKCNKVVKKANKSSCSLLSMSSILVNNKDQEQTIKNFYYSDKTKIKKYGNEKNKVKKQYSYNKFSRKENNLVNKILNIKEISNYNKNQFINNKVNRKPSLNTVSDMNNIGNKELFIEFLKFTNGIYKDKYIDENQKKLLKQLIIIYMESKNSHSNKK